MNKDKAINNLDELIANVEDARLQVSQHHIVKIIGISKYSNSEDVESLYNAGQRAFGENKVQDLKQKMTDLEELPLEWHFVGRLQKNKINNLIDLKPALIQSIDSLELAQELDKKLSTKGRNQKCLLQINSAKEDSKAGVMPEDAVTIYKQIQDTCPNITLRGVMSIGAHIEDEEVVKQSFLTTKAIFDELKSLGAYYCSMGMSGDYKLAISCGSNMIRVGSSLFK